MRWLILSMIAVLVGVGAALLIRARQAAAADAAWRAKAAAAMAELAKADDAENRSPVGS